MAIPNITLSDVNRAELAVYIPSIAYLCLMAVVGVVGNIFVVIVYGFKIKKRSTYRHFVLVLAMYDLTACCLGMPGLTVEMGLVYTFYSGVGCKVLRYGYHTIGAGTSLTHTMVSVDRYRRICKATDPQISVQAARSFSYIVLAMSLVIAMPAVLMYDSSEVATRVPNITGYSCVISDQYRRTIFPVMYSFAQIFLIMVISLTMIIMYTLIGRKLMQQRNFFKSLERARGLRGSETVQLSNLTLKIQQHFSHRIAPWPSADLYERESTAHTSVCDHESLPQPGLSVKSVTEKSKSAKLRRTQNREMASRKMTVTTFAITVAYICSFMPLLALELVTYLDDIEQSISFTEKVFYRLGLLTYTIDNVANPIIYLLLDADFRTGCKGLMRSIKCKLPSLI